ncbi:MAG: DEAD/DEAH box helicase [Chloroflexi bacterium]|nr:DEAD/DEAH box helicase [Chloroflexota bacterium]
MFDEYARRLIDSLPDLPDIDRVACRRALSTAYFYVVRTQLNLELDDNSTLDLENAQRLLRQMVDALESVAVFDRLNGQVPATEVETACAFVAAEALYLLAKFYRFQPDPQQLDDPILQEPIYLMIEAALLYMIGGYDINAVAVVNELRLPDVVNELPTEIYTGRLNNAKALLSRLMLFCSGNVRQPRKSPNPVSVTGYPVSPADPNLLVHKIRAGFYFRLAEGIDAYLDWLGGYNENGLDAALGTLQNLRATFTTDRTVNTEFADVYHLSCLLLAAIDRTSQRSLIHKVLPPQEKGGDFQQEFAEYLNFRARGDDRRPGRPFLWPSAIEYIRNCLPGPNRDAVISMPTGSGKSYIAELAITHALSSGWVLYLAPTNALVYQVRRDLSYALQPFQNITVRAFIGNEEYTTLSEEQINIQDSNFVAVMTPEKCSLALRLYPEIFAHCTLCIFDECHLLNDKSRGITADILISQLSFVGRTLHFILMSAMVGNPEQLAEWLSLIHDTNAVPLIVKWRPSRTMRGLLLLDQTGFRHGYERAAEMLRNLPVRRVKQEFSAPLAMIAGLSGPWTMDGIPDYRITALPISFTAFVSRRNNRYAYSIESWKNTSARQLAETFAKSNMPTICFILSSRHHTFSAADKINGLMPNAIGVDGSFPEVVEAWLAISDAELGRATILRDLLRRGIAVHSSAMLQTEQAASEWMFLDKKSPLMIATGTLAQGLNLPAIAVVIAGTSIGDARDQRADGIAGVSRINSMILNSFGRAGRPGFANQGLAILVSDDPYFASVTMDLDPSPALAQYQVMGEQDAAIEVRSPVETFIDTIIAGDLNPFEASKNDLVLTSLLAEYNEDNFNSGQILTRTLAAYHKRHMLVPNSSALFRDRLNLVRTNYFSQPDYPNWINKAAMISGVDYFRALRMWQAYNQHGFLEIEMIVQGIFCKFGQSHRCVL